MLGKINGTESQLGKIKDTVVDRHYAGHMITRFSLKITRPLK